MLLPMLRMKLTRPAILLLFSVGIPTYETRLMGTNRKPRPNTCTTRRMLADRKLISRSRCLRGVVHGKRKREPAKSDEVARLDFGREIPCDRHQKQEQQAAAGKHQARRLGRITHEGLKELGHHHEAGEKHDSQNEHHGVGAEEVQVLEESHFDDRGLVEPFPDGE